ncbi:MAG: GDP-mannose 4,6-dehydratase [Oscillospiraceae bacterium]
MTKQNISTEIKTILVTGVAGFIGAGLAKRLLLSAENIRVVGVDNMNDYYDVRLKEYRLSELMAFSNFIFIKGSIANKGFVDDIFNRYSPQVAVNLAAQAGVRYSITNPYEYIQSNLIGFFNILEGCRYHPVEHLVYASSSSVYGANKKLPYSPDDKTDNPISLYAATKKSNELMASAYSALYKIPSTALRLFTVYGPLGRPDMAYFSFTDKLCKGEKIQIFNEGKSQRDFTYIDDVITAIIKILPKAPVESLEGARHKIYNIGNGNPQSLLDFVDILQQELMEAKVIAQDYDFNAHKELVPMQPGDVEITYAQVEDLVRDIGFKPSTNLREGLRRFAMWYKDFYC